jgi:cyclopropane fatty-acyl-phospholipid synthase-like methyltransferase
MSNDFFKHKAESYEQDNRRVENVQTIAATILSRIDLKPDMELMDFGSGTGLLLEQIAPFVRSIAAVDISTSMNEQLNKKRADLACELEIIEMDLTVSDLDRKFDGIISSMTLHHVDNLKAMFDKLYVMLKPGGFIALADLETEDGSFHTEDTGVFHFGFSRKELMDLATGAGFSQVKVNPASMVHKPYGDYPVLLLTAIA